MFVVARTINTDDGSEGRLLRLVTQGGEKEWVLPMEVFGGSGEDARRALFARGGLIAMRKRGAFMEYLLDQQRLGHEPRRPLAAPAMSVRLQPLRSFARSPGCETNEIQSVAVASPVPLLKYGMASTSI